MRTRIYNKVWLVTLLSLVACSHGDEVGPVDPTGEVAMSFNANVDDVATTRAVINLQDAYKSFLVKAYKTAANDERQTVMPAYEVRFDDTRHWYYDGINGQYLKYWDASAEGYTFAAVTPIPNNAADAPFAYKDTKVEIGDDGNISITGIKGNMPSSADDSSNPNGAPQWMVARTVRTNGAEVTDDDALDASHKFHYDDRQQPTKVAESLYATVPLMFHHVFAKVDFKAYSASGFITLKNFKVTIPDAPEGEEQDLIINQGDYSTTGGWKNTKAATKDETNSQQDPQLFCDYPYLDGSIVPEGKDNAVLLASHIQIPHVWAEAGRQLEITCETPDGTVYKGTIKLDKDNNGKYIPDDTYCSYSGWRQGVHYTYILKIDAEGSSEVILFSVNMNKCKWQEGNSIEDEQTNW